MLAVLKSTKYRTRYFEEIKNDFPGIPPLADPNLRRRLARLGQRLIRAQLLKAEMPEAAFRFAGNLGGEIKTPELAGVNDPGAGDYLRQEATLEVWEVMGSRLDVTGEYWLFQVLRSANRDWGGA